MSNLLERIVKEYNDYLKINEHSNKIADKAKNARKNLKDLSEESLTEAENVMADSILLASESRLRFEQLTELIKVFIEVESTPLPTEIETFYKDNLRLKVKRLFVVDKEEVQVLDKDIMDGARETVKKQIKSYFDQTVKQ